MRQTQTQMSQLLDICVSPRDGPQEQLHCGQFSSQHSTTLMKARDQNGCNGSSGHKTHQSRQSKCATVILRKLIWSFELKCEARLTAGRGGQLEATNKFVLMNVVSVWFLNDRINRNRVIWLLWYSPLVTPQGSLECWEEIFHQSRMCVKIFPPHIFDQFSCFQQPWRLLLLNGSVCVLFQ